jgi:4-amino-4-deoxy-L-arabinose transferase-like glycosyltransferase
MKIPILFSKKFDLTILFSLICIYLFLSSKEIMLPGVNFDETFAATGTLSLLRNKNTDYVYLTDWTLWGRRFPLMTSAYDPALSVYLLLPFFFVFGINVFSLRIAPISFGLLTLVFTYIFVKKFFNQKAALIAMLLLVTNPYFIFAAKAGNYFLSYALFFSITALVSFLKWYESGRIHYFILGSFLLGLGLSTLIHFGVLIIALVFLFLIFRKNINDKIQQTRIKSLWIYLFLAGIFFCLGIFLFLYANLFNASTRFITLKCIFERFPKTGDGVTNLNYLNNLSIRFKNLLDFLGERDPINRPIIFKKSNIFYLFVFFFAFLWLVFSLLFKKNMYFGKKTILFILSFIGITFIVSPFTLSSFKAYHFIILIPYIQLMTVIGLIEFSQHFRKKLIQIISRWLVFLIVLILIGFNLKIIQESYVDLKKLGGPSIWSDAIYELADWLKEVRPSKIIALTWGLSRNLYFLLEGETYVYDIHSSPDFKFNEESFKNMLNHFFQDEQSQYIANIQWNDQRAFELFKKAVNIAGKKLIEEKTFYHRDGKPLYIIYSVR